MKKRRNILLTALALALILTAGIGSARAYFTTYASAQGGIELHLGTRREFTEEFSSWTKTLTVHNNDDSAEPIYVRAKVFAPTTLYLGTEREKFPLNISVNGTNWSETADANGYYYYSQPVAPDGTTEALNVVIEGIPAAETDEFAKLQEGDQFSVVVVYESIPVPYDANGNAIAPADADWSRTLDNGTTTATEGGDNP